MPGEYPLPQKSYMLINNGSGNFMDMTLSRFPDLTKGGMITDAAWVDLNNDSRPDLITVGEFMPVRVFINYEGKKFREATKSWFEVPEGGFWNKIAVADFDHDGDMDIIAGNFGTNSQIKSSVNEPVKLMYKDFDNNGSLDIVLSYYENDTLFPLRGKQCSTQQLPGLKDKFKDYNSFGLATVEDVYGSSLLNDSEVLEAKTFASGILINTKEGFELVKLPKIAQISAVFGIVYDDFDKDGLDDIVIAGNLYNSEVETPRNDAGQGLFLKRNAKGGFDPVRGYNSGLFIPGDVKKLKSIRLGSKDASQKGILVGVNDDIVKLISAQ